MRVTLGVGLSWFQASQSLLEAQQNRRLRDRSRLARRVAQATWEIRPFMELGLLRWAMELVN